MDEGKLKKLSDRIIASRIRLLQNHGFFGLLLMHVIFAVDEKCGTAATDGERIFFGPAFTEKLSDWELDFVMMHEVLHIALKHVFRGKHLDNEAFNLACDIVINSNIMKAMDRTAPIVLGSYGEAMHLAPNGRPGHEYTAEEVYDMLPKSMRKKRRGDSSGASSDDDGSGFRDDHDKWNTLEEPDYFQEKWDQNIIGAAEAAEIRTNAKCTGIYSKDLIDRILQKLKKPQLDWRTILNTFVQEEIVDYSFTPPDRRFDESPFFLPDLNEKEYYVKDILFMIDTSRSMSEEEITIVYSEVKGSIEQFDGKLCGKLGFFLYKVVPPVDFANVDDILAIKPKGGGGTSFTCVFEYVNKEMSQTPPACIIMLTDGHGNFPDEKITNDIPVLWLITNEFVNPPWGRIARIKV